MKALHIIAFILVIIGGLNWGLHGLFEFNLVHAIFQSLPMMVERVVYVLVGLAAIVLLITHAKDCKMCMGMGMKKM